MPPERIDHLTEMGLREAPTTTTMQPDPDAELATPEKPLVTPALVAYLRKQFQASVKDIPMGLEVSGVHRMLGHLEVIDHLSTLIDRK